MSNASGEFGDGLGEPWASRQSHGMSTETMPRRSLVNEGHELDVGWDSLFATEASKADSMTETFNAGDSQEALSPQRMRVEGVNRGQVRNSTGSGHRRLVGDAATRAGNTRDVAPHETVGPPDAEQLEELTRIFGVLESVNSNSESRGPEALPPQNSMEQSTMVSEDSGWDHIRSIMSSIDEVHIGISKELREEMSLFTEGDAPAHNFRTTSYFSGSGERPMSRSVVRPRRPKLRAKDPFHPKGPPPSEGQAVNALEISQSTFSAQAPTLQVNSINKFLAKDGNRCDPSPNKKRPMKAFPAKTKAQKEKVEPEKHSQGFDGTT